MLFQPLHRHADVLLFTWKDTHGVKPEKSVSVRIEILWPLNLIFIRFANRLLRELDLGEWMAADHKPLAPRRALSKRIVCSYGQLPHRYQGEF